MWTTSSCVLTVWFNKRTQNAIRSKCMLQEKEYFDMLARKI